MPKEIQTEKIFWVGETSENSEKKWGVNLYEIERKCKELLLEEACEKSFSLMDSFWEVIAGAHVNLSWLIKIRSHLDKTEKEQEKVKQKKLSSLSRNSILKNMVLRDSMITSLTFNSNQTFLYCNCQCPHFENLYTLLTIK